MTVETRFFDVRGAHALEATARSKSAGCSNATTAGNSSVQLLRREPPGAELSPGG
jgi:hypothetical protein